VAINRDPIGEEGGLNLYGFVGNHPNVCIDLLGRLPLRSNFANGVYDTSIDDRSRMERNEDTELSKRRYNRLAQIRKEAGQFVTTSLNAAGVQGAIYANLASQDGPRKGDAIIKVFNNPVEYGGRVCCRDQKYKLTGPYTTGGMDSIQHGGFPYQKTKDSNDQRYRPLPTDIDLWPDYLKDLQDKEELKSVTGHTGSLEPCPNGWSDVGGYHTHPGNDASPSPRDKFLAKRRPEYVSGFEGGVPGSDLRRINKDGSNTRLNPNGTTK
jgi:hypothetical protein